MELTLPVSNPQTKKIALRTIFFGGTLFVLALTPWWVTLLLTTLGIIIFRFYELLAIGLLLDALYQNQGRFFFESDYLFTSFLLLCTTASLLLSHYLYRV